MGRLRGALRHPRHRQWRHERDGSPAVHDPAHGGRQRPYRHDQGNHGGRVNRARRIIEAVVTPPAPQGRLASLISPGSDFGEGVNAVFVLLSLCVVLIFVFPTLRVYWPLYLLLYAVCQVGLLHRFYLAHRDLMPEAVWFRRRALVTMILMPTSAIRAGDALSRYVLSAYHPLAGCDHALSRGGVVGLCPATFALSEAPHRVRPSSLQ